MLVCVLALPALRAEDQPKDEKTPPSAREQYGALLKDFVKQQQQIIADARTAKGDEQQKQLQRYYGLGKDFADKFYKLAEENSKDAVAVDALFWVLQNGAGSPVFQKALDKVATLVAEMPLGDLVRRVKMMRGGSPAVMETVFKRAEKDAKDPLAGDLLAWIATNVSYLPIGQRATTRLIELFPDHQAIEQVCQALGYGNSPSAADTLKIILEKSSKERVKASAAMGLGRVLSARADQLGAKQEEADKVAADAEKYLVMVIDQLGKDNATLVKDAERELKSLRTLRVGKEAPDIAGGDLDEKQFKLTDYRGKVVLLDFWGHW